MSLQSSQSKDGKSARQPNPAQQQQRRDREFSTHKLHILNHLSSSACDLSPKGSVDAKCLPLMHTLNTHENYITTSSCSGRIALFHSAPPAENSSSSSVDHPAKLKRGAPGALGWLLVKHGALRLSEAALVVCALCGTASDEADRAVDGAMQASWTAMEAAEVRLVGTEAVEQAYSGELGGVWLSSPSKAGQPPLPSTGTIALKMEPFVMHVECRTLDSAKTLLSAAVSDAGYRNSGVVPPGKKIMCGIRSAAGLGLEVPLMLDGTNYAMGNRAYVWSLLKVANEKMFANERKIRLLERSVAARLGQAA